MRPPTSGAESSPIDWRDDGLPASRLYGDVYFSSDDGLAESEAVYLAGCGLPEAWAGRRAFTVGELGFGTGLNIAALLTLWRGSRPAGATLNIFTIEAHPLSREDAARALGRWPRVSPAAEAMLAAWPSRSPGFHRLQPEGFDATIDLAVLPVETALAAWSGQADAWFLDGFSPALNPAMWSDVVMAAVAARSAPGARAATFTVAGGVRRALTAAGFMVDKRPGFGRKRERLEARLPGEAAREGTPPTVAVIGAGVAGASLIRAIRALGGEARLFDAEGHGAGASGNPAALVTPALDAGGGPRARLYAQAFDRAVPLYEAAGAVIARGAVQLETEPRDALRFDKVVAGGLFEAGDLTRLDVEAASAALGEPVVGGLRFDRGLTVAPDAALAAWAGDAEMATVDRLEREGAGWRLLDAEGREIAQVDAVILAAGADIRRLWPTAPVRPVRGQASWAKGVTASAAAFGGYVIPTRDGVLFGATFDRDDTETDVRDADQARNLSLVGQRLPALASRLAALPLGARARVRATTPDHLPLAGTLGDGLFVLGGLGSRGFCLAPLLAEHVAALVLDRPSPLPVDLATAVDPLRV